MMRLADYLIRWTGDVDYADYGERNLYNGILAQQHPDTGMVTYFLPLRAGGAKRWGTPTDDFWCCHGTLVEAHAVHSRGIYYRHDEGVAVCQYLPSELTWDYQGVGVTVAQAIDTQKEQTRRPQSLALDLTITCDRPVEFTLKLRLPWWLAGAPRITVDGERADGPNAPSTWYSVRRTWTRQTMHIVLPKRVTAVPLPDAPEMVAFMDGPVVLAGLSAEEGVLRGEKHAPESMLTPDNEREWGDWEPGWRTRGQARNIRFTPLYAVRDEPYTVYFPVHSAPS